MAAIAILEDDPNQLETMQQLLSEHAADSTVVTFGNAIGMNDWLQDHLDECALICLEIDRGIGNEVMDHLSTQAAGCPVIVHSTDVVTRPTAIGSLQDAGWVVGAVTPYEDDLWIREVWITEVVLALQGQL